MKFANILVAFSAAFVVAAAARQNPPAGQTPVFRAGVDLVQLDVSVLDKNRRPVRGLTQADFTVLEDGKPQTVEAFAAVDLPDAVAPTAAWMRDVTPDVTTNELGNHRIFVLLLDDGMSPNDLWAIRAVKQAATSIIDHFGPADLATVIFTRDNRHTQDLTPDHAKLIKAVNTFSSLGRPSVDVGPPGASPRTVMSGGGGGLIGLYSFYSGNALACAAEYLAAAGLPQQRKAIIYVSPAGFHGGGDDRMDDAVRAAQAANINVYPIDPCGLRAPGASGGCGMGPVAELLKKLANNTGGKAIVESNDFEPGITQMFVENSSYYVLGYRPANVKADGTFRRLEVKVDRPDVEARTRQNYVAPKAPKPSDAPPPPPPPPGIEALASIIPKTDLPLRTAVAAFATPGVETAAVTVALGLRQTARAERVTEQAVLTVRAFTPEGDPRGSADQPITVNIPPARRGSDVTRYDLLARIDLKPGRYELRISAHSAVLDKLGSVYADVEVPDFAKAPLSLSGVMLSATPGVPVAPAEALSAVVPVLPTTERTFARTDRVSTFLRVYQGGNGKLAPVSLAIRIVDDHDKKVIDQTDALGADKFATARAADERFALPLAQLAPGEYLLTFEATMGKTTARRDVRFTVR